MLSLIAAVAENGVIGRAGALPWHLPEDLAHFKRVTTGRRVIMGRRTFESIGRPLPRRENVVLSRDREFAAPGCRVVESLDAALEGASGSESFVIGGAALYAEALPRAQRLYLTRVHASVEGDRHFPELDPAAWRVVERLDYAADDRHAHSFSIVTLERA